MILFVQAINVIRFRSQVVSLLYVVEQICCSQSLCCASLGLSHIDVVQSEPESCMVSYPELGNHFSSSFHSGILSSFPAPKGLHFWFLCQERWSFYGSFSCLPHCVGFVRGPPSGRIRKTQKIHLCEAASPSFAPIHNLLHFIQFAESLGNCILYFVQRFQLQSVGERAYSIFCHHGSTGAPDFFFSTSLSSKLHQLFTQYTPPPLPID